ncbi:hypothetical protein [Rhizobium sp. RHZ01]|uniref:hypothetical protein n=1 Tax=Rhizobium sp. RHZ01 TaxID=2769304 RepID=UPI00178476BD|nr:hypothetical protein [Rhizobium sp. RHZ01]MBD9449671.1 hypothetical protein [Rhizobium sp. RHZ01]
MKALENRKIQISLSTPPDHLKLGIPPRELDRALLSVCMALVRAGATVVYGGDLRPDGFSFKIFRHLARAYADSNSVPFIHIIDYVSLAKMTYEILENALTERRGTCVTYVCVENTLSPVWLGDDEIIVGDQASSTSLQKDPAFTEWVSGLKHLPQAEEMTASRKVKAEFADACVAIGGKMGLVGNGADLSAGAMPGIFEESLLMLKGGKPLIPLGAYGGATRDMAIALDLLGDDEKVPRGKQVDSYNVALEDLASCKTLIPQRVYPKLKSLAKDDRAEILARDAVDTIKDWLAER